MEGLIYMKLMLINVMNIIQHEIKDMPRYEDVTFPEYMTEVYKTEVDIGTLRVQQNRMSHTSDVIVDEVNNTNEFKWICYTVCNIGGYDTKDIAEELITYVHSVVRKFSEAKEVVDEYKGLLE
jgi:hypothetical protein